MNSAQLISSTFILNLIGSLFFAFFALLFIQSGMEKALDWKGNREWLTGHFSKSILAGMVPLLLGILMAMELLFGFGNVLSIILLWLNVGLDVEVGMATMFGNCLTLLALFFGQRMAKDYVGAAGITAYFVLAMIGTIYCFIVANLY